MALKSVQVAVGNGAAVDLLDGLSNKASVNDQCPALIRNTQASGGSTLYVGGPDVSTSNGMPLLPLESLPFLLLQSDSPWAISGGGSITVAVLIGRQS